MIELETKRDELELLLNGEVYQTASGVNVRFGGKLIGFTVGCEERTPNQRFGF